MQSVGISQLPAAYSYTNSQTPFTQTFQPLTSNPQLSFPSVMLPSPPSTQPPPAAARSHTRAPSVPSVPTPTYTSGIAADGGHYERPADTGGKGAAPGGTAGGDAEEEQRSSEYTTSSTAFDDATEASQTWEQLERDQPLVSPRVRVPHGGAPPKLAPAHADNASSARLTPYVLELCYVLECQLLSTDPNPSSAVSPSCRIQYSNIRHTLFEDRSSQLNYINHTALSIHNIRIVIVRVNVYLYSTVLYCTLQ